MSVLPMKMITTGLLAAYARSEKEKHAGCVGGCKHAKQVMADTHCLSDAVMGCPEIQERLDKQVATLLQHMLKGGDQINSIRTFAVAMMAQGWELAEFALEGAEADRKFGVQ